MQISNQPITRQQVSAFMHVDMINTTYLKFKHSVKMKKKAGVLNMWLLVADGLV